MSKSSVNSSKAIASIQLGSEKDTSDLAKKLALAFEAFFLRNPSASLHIDLVGDLGAGKTTFTRYLLNALGHQGKVKSPTYALCEPYQIHLKSHSDHPLTVHHFDLYRMTYAKEWIDAGFRDAFSEPGICLVEWPEKAEGTLSATDLTIQLRTDSDDEQSRLATIMIASEQGQALMNLMESS